MQLPFSTWSSLWDLPHLPKSHADLLGDETQLLTHPFSMYENPEGEQTSFRMPFMGATLPIVKTRLEKQDETQVLETAVYKSQIFRF